jgi:kinesin family protein 5
MNKDCVADFLDSGRMKVKKEVNEPTSQGHDFAFDHVFPPSTTQVNFYETTGKPVVTSCLAGFNGTVFAYGQTSSGKTFTMQGPNLHDKEMKGMTPRMIEEIYNTIEMMPETTEFLIQIAVTEIYKEKLRDLLDVTQTNLKIRESASKGVYIDGVTEKYAATQSDVWTHMETAYSNRVVGHTNMNAGSSRSHLIVMLSIFQNDKLVQNAKRSKLFLIDLAGSEKISKTGAQGERLEEAKKINQSLSALGNVINALTDSKAAFIPYRNSVLTRMLQDSIGGNSKTTLIITCSPSEFNLEETISTLRFGERAKKIKNMAKINREMTVAELTRELERTNKKMGGLERKIKFLEDFITDKGLEVPEFDEDGEAKAEEKKKKEVKEESKKKEKKAEIEEGEEEASNDNDSYSSGNSDEETDTTGRGNLKAQIEVNEKQAELFEKIASQYEERIRSVEREMMLQRKNIMAQNERMASYKNELTATKNNLLNRDKENESLVKKLADLTVQNKMMVQKQEPLKKRLESLETLNKTLTTQLEDLKKSRAIQKKEETQVVEKAKIDSSMPEGLYDLLKELAEKPGLGINYTLKIKNYLNDIDAPTPKKSKGKDMGYLNSLSLLKRQILGYNLNDKTLANALDALKELEIGETFSSALQIVFNKVSMASKDSSKAEGAKAASTYKPQPEKFENASALQMKYEDLKKSSELEITRLNNHVKALMEKLAGAKEAKKSEKGQKFTEVVEDKNKLIKALQDQVLTLKEKLKDATSKKNEEANAEEEDEMNEAGGKLKAETKAAKDEKTAGHMIKTVTRQSVKFGAQR